MLDPVDAARLCQLIDGVKKLDVNRLLVEMTATRETAGRDRGELATILEHCSFDHGGLLVFPEAVRGVKQFLLRLGLDVRVPVPSVVVRQRLAHRYDVSRHLLDVSIVRATMRDRHRRTRGVEVFCLPRRTAENAAPAMVARERIENNEDHFALNVQDPDPEKLVALRRVLVDGFAMRAQGGGYNPNEDAELGGRSVLYFSMPRGARFELTCTGDYSSLIRPAETEVERLPPSR